MYSSPRAPNFETDMSIDDSHATDEESVSSVQSEESTMAPLSPPGMTTSVCQGYSLLLCYSDSYCYSNN